MNCPHCSSEIPENATECPECGGAVGQTSENQKKDERKVYTHYKIVLIQPGPRKDIVSVLKEITGLSTKQVEGYLKELPWTVASRIPFSEAQELKILLERNKALVRLSGMEQWELTSGEETAEEKTAATTRKPKKNLKRQLVIFAASMVLIIAAAAYLLIKLDESGSQGLVKFNEMQLIEKEAGTGGKSSGEGSGTAAGTTATAGTHDPNIINFRDEGPNPFSRQLAFRFELLRENDMAISVYNQSLESVTTLIKGKLPKDKFRVRWNGIDSEKGKVGPGMYFIRITSPGYDQFYKAVWLY